MAWKVYGDGWEFSSKDGCPRDVPAWGTLLIIQDGVEQGSSLSGRYFYWWHGRWFSADEVGFFDKMTHYAHEIDVVRVGRWVPDDQWNAVVAKAQKELSTIRSWA